MKKIDIIHEKHTEIYIRNAMKTKIPRRAESALS